MGSDKSWYASMLIPGYTALGVGPVRDASDRFDRMEHSFNVHVVTSSIQSMGYRYIHSSRLRFFRYLPLHIWAIRQQLVWETTIKHDTFTAQNPKEGYVHMLKAGPQKRCRTLLRANSKETESGAIVVRRKQDVELALAWAREWRNDVVDVQCACPCI